MKTKEVVIVKEQKRLSSFSDLLDVGLFEAPAEIIAEKEINRII